MYEWYFNAIYHAILSFPFTIIYILNICQNANVKRGHRNLKIKYYFIFKILLIFLTYQKSNVISRFSQNLYRNDRRI